MTMIGIIDIGSNSIRLILVQVGNKGSFRIVDELKEVVRLAAETDEAGNLHPDRMTKAIQVLKVFKNLCDVNHTETIIPIATEAVRKAPNQNQFTTMITQEVGLEMQILTGDEEAYYDFIGVQSSIDIQDGLLMDLGGGSTELVLIKDGQLAESISLPLGSINIEKRFQLGDGKLKGKEERAMKQHLQETFDQIPWLQNLENIPLIGVGGTFRNMAKIDQEYRKYPLPIVHNYQLKSDDLLRIYDQVKKKDLQKRKKIPGLSKDRADIIVGATGVISSLLEYTKIQEVIISGSGVREGLVYNYLNEHFQRIENPLDYSIQNIALKFSITQRHANHVFKLTRSIFDQLKELHQLGPEVDKILKTASILHDCGAAIRYYQHHEHSFYLILNAGINGLTHRELLMSGYIAASHRNRKYVLDWNRYKGVINEQDVDMIEKIAILLRIAESLDRSMTEVVEDVKVTILDELVQIKIIGEEYPELEIYDALSAGKQFGRVYHKELEIE